MMRYVGYAVRRAQVRLYESFYATLDNFDVTPARFTLLVLIRDNPGIRPVDLARVIGVARSGMVRLLDDLQGRGWIRREILQSDRRNQAIFLTPLGRRKLTQLERAVDRHEANATRHLSSSERRQLLDMLWRVGI
jgi:DNA-binding MarR family transcriptional regulator